MRTDRSVIVGRAVSTGITVLLLAFIFGNSAAEGEDSGSLSLMVTMWLNSVLDRLGIPLELSHFAVRKLAHFTEYSLLGASITAACRWWSTRRWAMKRVWLPLLCGAATAGLDEWLQTFVPDRHGCVSDALLDFSGVLWAALAMSALMIFAGRKNKRTEENKRGQAVD